jgi:transcriptional regulator with XRE-family HTH domain
MLESTHEEKTLKQYRESLGYSQEYLASKLGLTRNAYARYESGHSEPKLSNFLAISKELRIPLKILAQSMGYDTAGIPDDSPN